MNDRNLFDDIARSLATPMPRRQLFGKILGGLAGAALASVAWPGRAQGFTPCVTNADCGGNGAFCCNSFICCASGQTCCGSGSNSLCCPAGGTCCGTGSAAICCTAGEVCTGHGGRYTCTTVSPR